MYECFAWVYVKYTLLVPGACGHPKRISAPLKLESLAFGSHHVCVLGTEPR